MAQRVRRCLDSEAGDSNVLSHQPLDRAGRHPHARAAGRQVRLSLHADKEWFPAVLPRVQVPSQPAGGGIAQKYDAWLSPFADHPELSGPQVDVITVEASQLREPQSGAEEGLHQGAVAQPAKVIDVRSLEQTAQLLAIEEFQRPRWRFAKLDPVRGEHVETLQGPVA